MSSQSSSAMGVLSPVRSRAERQHLLSQPLAGARAMRWCLCVLERWEQLPPELLRLWSVYRLDGHQTGPDPSPRAVLFRQHRQGWWGLLSVDSEAALSALRLAQRLGPLRVLEGDAEVLEPVLEGLPGLRSSLRHRTELLLLRRALPGLRSGRASSLASQRNLEQSSDPSGELEGAVDGAFPTVPGTRLKPPPSSQAWPLGFRLGQDRDLSAVVDYHRQVQLEAGGEVPSEEAISAALLLGNLYVLERAGEITSLAVITPAARTAYLRDLYTFAPHRRKGQASALLGAIVQVLHGRFDELYLCVNEDNLAARALYARFELHAWGKRVALSFEAKRR